MSPWLRRRLWIDRLVAGVLLVPLGPVLLVLAAWVRQREGAPAMISVPRVGRAGRLFRMRKVRTMRVGAPGGLAGGPPLTARGDARVTPTGRILRRWRLDELAQVLNVARGDMLLLGPRPEAPEYVSLADERWRAVLAVPPGIAGPTQVLVDVWESDLVSRPDGNDRYRGTVLPVKLALDEWYVRRATPALDLLVVWSLLRKLGGRPPDRLRAVAAAAVPELERVIDG